MIELPSLYELPIDKLSICFNEVTNSYKFYWFLSIVESVNFERKRIFRIDDLLVRMLVNVWYPANFYRLSFGKQDMLGKVVADIQATVSEQSTITRTDLVRLIEDKLQRNKSLSTEIRNLGNYVPFRFLRPFFNNALRGKQDWQINNLIVQKSESSFFDKEKPCIYRFIDNGFIEIQPKWYEYVRQNIAILRGFIFWHLVNYLQKNNPNVSNISNKLFEGTKRDLHNAKRFWTTALRSIGSINCIYSNQPIDLQNLSLDHFLPWSYVAHDYVWNLIPTTRGVNSAKGNNLPNVERYFESFAYVQYRGFSAVADLEKAGMLEDYVNFFKTSSYKEISSLSPEAFTQKLRDSLLPEFQIAKNMGFNSDWVYIS